MQSARGSSARYALARRDIGWMRLVLRVIGFILGAGVAFVGGTIWMLSNDGLASEATMKLFGGAAILVGGVLLVAAVLPRSSRIPGADNSRRI